MLFFIEKRDFIHIENAPMNEGITYITITILSAVVIGTVSYLLLRKDKGFDQDTCNLGS